MLFDCSDAEVQKIVTDGNDEFAIRIAELQSLRKHLSEKQQISLKLEDDLKEATNLQKTVRKLLTNVEQRIRQQFDDVSELINQFRSVNVETHLATSNNEAMAFGGVFDDVQHDVPVVYIDSNSDVDVAEYNDVVDMEHVSVVNYEQDRLGESTHAVSLITHFKANASSTCNEKKIQKNDRTDGRLQAYCINVESQSVSDDRLWRKNSERVDGETSHHSSIPMANYECKFAEGDVSVVRNRVHPDRNTNYVGSGNVQNVQTPLLLNDSTVLFEMKSPSMAYKCDICKKDFNEKRDLSRHYSVHRTGEKLHKCPICDQSFRQKITLTRHSMIHSDERPFVCDICQSTFRRKWILSDHMNTHSGAKPHECPVCKETFRIRNSLRIHLQTHR